jgi:polysaccharide biosynthesis/export protein
MHPGVNMRKTALALLTLAATVGVAAQQDPILPSTTGGMTTLSGSPNLPVNRIGDNDLLGVAVYDAPPLTGPVRVSQEGVIRLPMVKQPIHAAGLYPRDLEKEIAATLIKDHLLVDPIVTVTIIEYDSRPITVVGSVKSPITFQAMGTVTLLDAISRAQGLTADAGSEILISSQATGPDGKETTLSRRVPVRNLFDNIDPALNVVLHGGELVRVPEAGRVFVVGDVKKPGPYFITDGSQSSIMRALALSEGLGDHASHTAYIYRQEDGAARRDEIPVPLKKIMDRKSPDVALSANDILYIPDANGRRISAKVLEGLVGAGSIVGSAALYAYH